jgi:hypothetical protein
MVAMSKGGATNDSNSKLLLRCLLRRRGSKTSPEQRISSKISISDLDGKSKNSARPCPRA